jgi:hypothetical protein
MPLEIILLNLDETKKKQLEDILKLYKKTYPKYKDWKIKTDSFSIENQIRLGLELDETTSSNEHLGYIIDSSKKSLILDEKLINFMFKRFNGLQNCICGLELYLENNKDKDTSNEHKKLDFFKVELEKLKVLISEYEKNKENFICDKNKKIEFIKKICNTINWGYEDDFDTCPTIIDRKDLHPKTYGNNKQLVLGSRDNTDLDIYRKCNKFFFGRKIFDRLNPCDIAVEYNTILNKYFTLSAYYSKAPFIRFLLIDGLILPHKRYPPIRTQDIKGTFVAKLNLNIYNFNIYLDDDKLIFYDEENYIIKPPLLRSDITITFTEIRDLMCYLNLPVFESTVEDTNILFFPNYDLHQELLAIQGLPKNYSTYTGRSIEWKWFKDDEIAAKEAISCFCKKFEERKGVGIRPVQYEWFEIKFNKTNSEKRIFRVCSIKEYKDKFWNLSYLKKDGKIYVHNYGIIGESLDLLISQYGFTKPESIFRKFPKSQSKSTKPLQSQSRWQEKYLKYKKKYLELKSKYLELKNKN